MGGERRVRLGDRTPVRSPVDRYFVLRHGNTMARSELSAAQIDQRADARKMAVIVRKRRQLERLYNEIREVREKIIEMGVRVDATGRPMTGVQTEHATTAITDAEGDVQAACSEAGAALRRCAQAKKRASAAYRQKRGD